KIRAMAVSNATISSALALCSVRGYQEDEEESSKTVGQLQFMDVEVEQDDLNQKFLTSLAPEWLMHTIVWRNMSDLDTMSLDDSYNHLKVYEIEVQKKTEPNTQNTAFISSAKHSRGNDEFNTASVYTARSNVPTARANVSTVSISQETTCAYIPSQSSRSQIKFEDINQIDEDDMEEMDINWNMALLSMRAYKAPKNQDRGRRDNYRQGSKAEEQAPKASMAIDKVGWDWIYMENDKEDHVLVADEEAPTEFALMANTSTESKVLANADPADSRSGRTITPTTEDIQKKKNDVKARTTLLLSLPDEHQLTFSKYKTTRELSAAILKTFGGNEATKKRKK
nr:hypothetical protein [Tanacetum cinerariifolium]